MKISILLLFVNALLCFGDETFQCMEGWKYSVDGEEQTDDIELTECRTNQQACIIAEGSFVTESSEGC